MRRIIIICLILLSILALGWYFAWTFIAGKVDEQASAELIRLEEQGTLISCGERSVVGFPFAFKVSCSDADIVDRNSQVIAALDSLEAGASVYSLGKIKADLTSPLKLSIHGASDEIEALWKTAKVSVSLDSQVFSAGSFAIDDLIVATEGNQLAVQRLVGDIREALSPGSTLIGITADNAEIIEGAGRSIPVRIDARAQLNVPPEALSVLEQAARQSGVNVRNIALDIEGPDMRVRTVGDLEIDPSGIVSGELAVQIFDVEALPAALERLPEAYRSVAGAAVTGALAMGRATSIDGETARELAVTIDRGSVRSGFIPIGQLPPLFR